ncbi:MAG: protein of unknown function SprT [Gemmatimonadetes bacterium]|nr:protein of unknown function SprT [Gemmatimonadota bacterium]
MLPTLSVLGQFFQRLGIAGRVPTRQRTPDPSQLALSFDAPAVRAPAVEAKTPRARRNQREAEAFLGVLRAHGLARIERLRLTRNRNVMVSFGSGQLRVHEGFQDAPPEILRAIVTFVEGRTRPERRAAQGVILAYPIRTAERPAAPRRETTHPDDEAMAAKLVSAHAQYNAERFKGVLRSVDVRVSRRMKSRLGHYSAAASASERAEIAISRRHIRRHGWTEALHTLLHEMVHQWQDESGLPIDHGRDFRKQARAVGIVASAKRAV